MTKAPKFREFIAEAKSDKKYKLLIITDEPEKSKNFHTASRLQEEAEKLGWKNYMHLAPTGSIQPKIPRLLRLRLTNC